MRAYEVTLKGSTPLLMHNDNIAWADKMDEWKSKPKSKKGSRAGDDRSPAFRWIGCLYHDDQVLGIPRDSLMACFREGGTLVPVPGGKHGKSFKAQSQTGLFVEDAYWPLLINGTTPVPVAPIRALEEEPSFAAHQEAAESLGFTLHLKRAKVGMTKHVRVRPLFDRWQVTGTVVVIDDVITHEILTTIMAQAGMYKGLGDWRPGGKTPGTFGMFTATVRFMKDRKDTVA